MSQTLRQITDILLAALVMEVEKDATIQTSHITKQPGDSITVDTDCDAMIWLREVESFPSTNGQSYDLTPSSCTYTLVHRIELGIVRKSPMPSEVLGIVDMPDEAEISEAADLQYEDQDKLYRAIRNAARHVELTPETYTPLGPLQGIIGGTWSVLVAED
ncbi:hypothetical protein SEA_RIZWANA_26 [Arthrobacter phage Rizwana]|nr:hypothetical protein SEA_RIZWANA_26 [Arthrobacter phage Rizwana]